MSDIASAYDLWSTTYDAQENETRDLDRLVLRSIVPDLSGRTVVECGCGTGKNSCWLAARCAYLIGLDFSAGMLRLARTKTRAPNALFVQHDLRFSWPIGDEHADLVLFNLVLEHIDDLTPVFGRAARALKSGGRLALSEYHPSRVAEGKGPVVKDSTGTATHRIPNFLHTLADYFSAASAVGLKLASQAEWPKTNTPVGENPAPESRERKPQLLSLLFEKP